MGCCRSGTSKADSGIDYLCVNPSSSKAAASCCNYGIPCFCAEREGVDDDLVDVASCTSNVDRGDGYLCLDPAFRGPSIRAAVSAAPALCRARRG